MFDEFGFDFDEMEMEEADAEILKLDMKHIWHPYTQHLNMPEPVLIDGASGAYLYDINDAKIFDAISSWWVITHGHGHPFIRQMMMLCARAMDQIIFSRFTHTAGVALAAMLIRALPDGLARAFYSDNGSTAVEVALKMAIQYWHNIDEPRHTIVALENGYHGDTFGAMSVSGSGVFTTPFADLLFDVVRLPDPSVNGEATCEEFEKLLESGAKPAALILEPMLMGAGGMRMYGADVVLRLRETCSEYGVIFIADEVLTGFGRIGPMFACSRVGITPDIVCLSKGLTGGVLPLGATVATEQIFNAFLSEDRSKMFFHGHSFTANHITCGAALANLAIFEDAECDRQRAKLEIWQNKNMDRIARLYPGKVLNKRVLGTVAAFDLPDSGTPGYLNSTGQRLAEFALQQNVLLRPLGNVVYVMPPYCTKAKELEHVYDVIADFLEIL